jgi:hypothetical protein
MADPPGNSEFTAEFFDESSRVWMENKVKKGQYTLYKCPYIHSNTRQCSNAATHNGFCKRHLGFLKSKKGSAALEEIRMRSQ